MAQMRTKKKPSHSTVRGFTNDLGERSVIKLVTVGQGGARKYGGNWTGGLLVL